MSLIDDYEALKNIWVDGGSLQNTQLAFELLEHRRENNIFEVGDLVVDNIEGIKKIYKIIELQRFGIYKVSRFVNLKFGEFRHATPEEIKAGHRL